MNATPPTLEDFNNWVLESHGATFDAMEGATGAAYRDHLDSFTRTNATLNLLAQFKAAHSTSPVAASADSPDSAASQRLNGLAAMSKDRQMVCLEAVWEIDAIARTLPTLAASTKDDAHVMGLVVRAMAGRLLRMTGVLMSGFDEETEPTEDLARIVMLNRGQG